MNFPGNALLINALASYAEDGIRSHITAIQFTYIQLLKRGGVADVNFYNYQKKL